MITQIQAKTRTNSTTTIRLPDVVRAEDLPGPTAMAWLAREGRVRVIDSSTAVSSLLPDSMVRRAQAASYLVPRRCTACGLLALWIWEGGAFPRRLEVIATLKPKSPLPHDVSVRLRRLAPGESMAVAGLRVTSPLRTAVDVACLPDDFFDVHVGAGRFVLFLHHQGLTLQECQKRLGENCRAVGYMTGRRRLEKLAERPEVKILLEASPQPNHAHTKISTSKEKI